MDGTGTKDTECLTGDIVGSPLVNGWNTRRNGIGATGNEEPELLEKYCVENLLKKTVDNQNRLS